jgi:hypothetical protein
LGQKRSNILRDYRVGAALAPHWDGSKQSGNQDRKNASSIHGAILHCRVDICNPVAQAQRKIV